MANPVNMLYLELLSQQRAIYLTISNNTLNKKQLLSSFYLSSQLHLARNVGQGEIGISIARASQIKTVFPYNIQASDKILGVSVPKMFRMPWIMVPMPPPPPSSRNLTRGIANLCQLYPLKISEPKTTPTRNSNVFSYHPWKFHISFN